MQRDLKGIQISFVLFATSLLAVPLCAQESRWKELDAQVDQLQKQGKSSETMPLAQEAVRIAQVAFGPEAPNTATSLQKLAMTDIDMGQYPEAETLLKRAIAIREKTAGPEAAPLAALWNGLGQLKYCEGKYEEAEGLFKRALAIGEKALGPGLPDVAESLNDIGLVYDAEGRFAEAEPVYQRALATREQVFGREHADVAETLNNLAILYEEQSRYAESEQLYKRALAINEKVLGPNHPQVATDLGNLALLNRVQGRYREAEQLDRRALLIDEKAFGADSPEAAVVLNNLAKIYKDQGRYGEQEQLDKRALAIYEKLLGPNHPNVATVLNNLADLYKEQGRMVEAEALQKRSLAIVEKVLGPDNPDVATAVNNLAVLYVAEGRYEEAEPLYKRAQAIREKVLGPEHPDVAGSMNNLAFLYEKQGHFEQAEPLYKRGLAIHEKARGANHPDVATDLGNLAALYAEQGRYDAAEPLEKRALEIDEKALGADHPRVATDLYCLSQLYYAKGNYGQAEQFVQHSLEILRGRFEYSFAYMSEKDRLQFLGTVRKVFTLDFSLALGQRGRDGAVAGRTYDLLLWQKGLVSASVATLRAQVAATGDAQAVKIFEDLTAKKSQSSRLVATRPNGWQEASTRADAEANDLEQQLARRVSSFADQKSLASATWRDVKNTLKPGDAAVEFVRFPFHDGKKQTDKICYIALVIRPENAQPTLIQLGEAHELEGATFSAYRAEVGIRKSIAVARASGATASPWRSLYDAMWKPLEAPLGDAKRVYVSLDGVLNEIPLGVLQRADGRRVMEKYDFRVVSSTRDLLRPSRRATSNTAILVGNPRFLLSDVEQRIALNRWHGAEKQEPVVLLASAVSPGNPASGALSRDATERGACDPPPPTGGVLCPLPGTATEIQSIGELLRGKDWVVADYQGEQALEEVVKTAANPRVLHLATHGFFLSDQQVKLGESLSGQSSGLEDPMMRSGLFFAGADRTLNSQPTIEGVETGVLTAYEATALNLQGTELVVLSACETGRGQVQNGEGVFGLGRALQEAGAESVLMSLWSVPDRETQELMTQFYKNWLTGMDKPEALRRAQLTERDRVKQRYGDDRPYYWGAFILVGR